MTLNGALSAEPNGPASALVIGNFDGVHRGHQALVAFTLDLAHQNGLEPQAMTFDPHPAQVLSGSPPPVLTTLERKIELLESLALGLRVVVQHFDSEFSRLSPLDFVERILVGRNHVRQLVVGANFRFGRNRAGNVQVLQELGERFGFNAHAFELSADAHGSISSSRIRQLITAGDVALAKELLGRPHALTGLVVHGDGKGRTIGFPTANLEQIAELRPLPGVYAAHTEILDGGLATAIGPSVVHIGPRPTVQRGETVEAHVIHQDRDLYGKTVRINLLGRVRGLVQLANLEALKPLIEQDVAAALQIYHAFVGSGVG
ncbi:MAG TPA: bifunctional riboflavin kinase/FAD synthetase [Polyangiaceae bacterium]|nr:bifunctional riboflavin kinase/FAD synthetase [Polyangiaceae bacterium]